MCISSLATPFPILYIPMAVVLNPLILIASSGSSVEDGLWLEYRQFKSINEENSLQIIAVDQERNDGDSL